MNTDIFYEALLICILIGSSRQIFLGLQKFRSSPANINHWNTRNSGIREGTA